MLPLRARVDLESMAMNGHSVFPKASALLFDVIPSILLSVVSRKLIGGVLPLCRDAVSVFCSPTDRTTKRKRKPVYANISMQKKKKKKKLSKK